MCCSTLKIGKILFILGIYLLQLLKKTYFLALGMIPVTGVGYIARKITVCNHCLPGPEGGRGIAMEMSSIFTFALSPVVRGKYQQKRQCNENIINCRGKLRWF